jgi:hypothetical protein
MKRALPLAALILTAAHPAGAQGYGQPRQQSFRFTGDSLARYEWTREIPALDGTINEDRYFVQARPRIELRLGPIELGVGGHFNYSQEDNTLLPSGDPQPEIRDNFYSRRAAFDLYYGKVEAGPVEAVGGRFLMPLPLTEMIWDRDLRPFGGSAGLVLAPDGSLTRFAIRGIYAKGSHWFEDESVLYGGSAELAIQSGGQSQIMLAGAYLDFRDLDTIDSRIRRRNALDLDGLYVHEYRVADVQARLVAAGQLPFSLVVDYCWNTALSENNKGLWAEVTLGQLASSRARLEYTYAKIDRDATLGAFNADDFYWGTGYQAHRVDLGAATSRSSSIHAIASWQRFKDSPVPEEQDQWVKRYRIEWRARY